MRPFFSVISVCFNDAWALTKTSRSVFRQSFTDLEYLIIDGGSKDGTLGLIDFWSKAGLCDVAKSEPDSGVYNAMNKGVRLAKGRFVCFMNAGDVFAHDRVLEEVAAFLKADSLDGILGWGELGSQIWASWVTSEAFKIASLGFCHQSLYVRRELLESHSFDDRPGRTDSDTLLLGNLYKDGARIPVRREILAIRDTAPGISANLEKTRESIIRTLRQEYGELEKAEAEAIVAFRRQCREIEVIQRLLSGRASRLSEHLAYLVLDTLFLRQSAALPEYQANDLIDRAHAALAKQGQDMWADACEHLVLSQTRKAEFLEERQSHRIKLKSEIEAFERQERTRLAGLKPALQQRTSDEFLISLTSFPGRISTVHLVIQSLLAQTVRPAEIHLWLGADEIPSKGWLPAQLVALENEGLKIHFAPKTSHQYDKFLHNHKLNCDRAFVIVDDDVIYPPHSMEELLTAHKKYPGAVIGNRCHQITFDEDGSVQPYSYWPREVQLSAPSMSAIPTGAGGVLYPRGFFNEQNTQVDLILSHAPYADDVWLKVCALAQGIPTMSTPLSSKGKWYLRYTPSMEIGALHATNVNLGLNDVQIRSAFSYLKETVPAKYEGISAIAA